MLILGGASAITTPTLMTAFALANISHLPPVFTTSTWETALFQTVQGQRWPSMMQIFTVVNIRKMAHSSTRAHKVCQYPQWRYLTGKPDASVPNLADYKIRIYDMQSPNVNKSVLDSSETQSGRRYRQYRMYYDEDKSSLSLSKTIQAREHLSSWTITDANLSPDNTKMIWSTIGPVVGMTRVRESADDMESYDDGDGQVALDFGSGRSGGRRHFGVSNQYLSDPFILANTVYHQRSGQSASLRMERKLLQELAQGPYTFTTWRADRPCSAFPLTKTTSMQYALPTVSQSTVCCLST
jgi:hypothetical protein